MKLITFDHWHASISLVRILLPYKFHFRTVLSFHIWLSTCVSLRRTWTGVINYRGPRRCLRLAARRKHSRAASSAWNCSLPMARTLYLPTIIIGLPWRTLQKSQRRWPFWNRMSHAPPLVLQLKLTTPQPPSSTAKVMEMATDKPFSCSLWIISRAMCAVDSSVFSAHRYSKTKKQWLIIAFPPPKPRSVINKPCRGIDLCTPSPNCTEQSAGWLCVLKMEGTAYAWQSKGALSCWPVQIEVPV